MRLGYNFLLDFVLACMSASASAQTGAPQNSGTCRVAADSELTKSISQHAVGIWGLNQKFEHYWYSHEQPVWLKVPTLAELTSSLGKLNSQRVAVLFYAVQDGRLCTWLISARGIRARHVQDVNVSYLIRDVLRIRRTLGVYDPVDSGEEKARYSSGTASTRSLPSNDVLRDSLVATLSSQLLPSAIISRVLSDSITVLAVVPIMEFSKVPFALLNDGTGRYLIDRVALTFVPSFESFVDTAVRRSAPLSSALIAAPRLKEPLPGAILEVHNIANVLAVNPLPAESATTTHITSLLTKRRPLGLFYLATHGVSSGSDPLDSSYLELSDAKWYAREIGGLSLTGGPLVVLSACQTGLGKSFGVGSTGLARAWYNAGASAVVMTLWNIGDAPTVRLMTDFVSAARAQSAEEALRDAILKAIARRAHPSTWAAFEVFGPPVRSFFIQN